MVSPVLFRAPHHPQLQGTLSWYWSQRGERGRRGARREGEGWQREAQTTKTTFIRLHRAG